MVLETIISLAIPIVIGMVYGHIKREVLSTKSLFFRGLIISAVMSLLPIVLFVTDKFAMSSPLANELLYMYLVLVIPSALLGAALFTFGAKIAFKRREMG